MKNFEDFQIFAYLESNIFTAWEWSLSPEENMKWKKKKKKKKKKNYLFDIKKRYKAENCTGLFARLIYVRNNIYSF